MEINIFTAGTAPGSPRTANEIKTLICYMLSEVKKPMSFSQLHEALRQDDLVNYFELIESLKSLADTGHIIKDTKEDVNWYQVTPLGEKTAETLDTSLPFTVRTKAVEAVRLTLARNKRLQEVAVNLSAQDDGHYKVELSIPDESNQLVSFTVLANNKEEAESLKKGFLNDPVFIYQSVMALLLGDYGLIADLKPEEENLF